MQVMGFEFVGRITCFPGIRRADAIRYSNALARRVHGYLLVLFSSMLPRDWSSGMGMMPFGIRFDVHGQHNRLDE